MKYSGFPLIVFKNRLASKVTNLTWFLAKPVSMIVAITVWSVIFDYSGSGLIGGFSVDQTINYMIFVIVFGSLTFTSISSSLGNSIQQGSLTNKLLKPVDYGISGLFTTLGSVGYALIFETIPALIIAVVFFGFSFINPLMVLFSFASLFLGLLINYFININWGLIYFRTIEYGSMEWIKQLIFRFFNGSFIPINFLPFVFQEVFNLMPFQYVIYSPARIFINSYSIIQVLPVLITQFFWIVLLYTIYRIGWYYTIKEFAGVGV